MLDKDQNTTGASASAAELSPFRRRCCVVLLVLLGFSLGCTEFAPIGIEPELSRAFNADLAQIGQLISLFAITNAFATPVLALTTGRFKRYTMLLVYSILCIAGNAIAVFAPTIEVLYVSRIICGIISGAFIAVGMTFIPELVDPSRTSATVAVVYAAYSVAMVAATSAGKALADALDWHAMMISCFVFAVLTCALLLAFMPRAGATDDPAPAREQIGLLLEPSVLACIAVFIFGAGSTYVFYGYVTPYLETLLGLTAGQASLTLLVFGVLLIFSNLISGALDTRFGLKTNVVLFVIQAAVLLGLWIAGAATVPALCTIMALGLVMYVMNVPCVSHFIDVSAKKYPKALTLASSLEPMTFNAGIAFGTAVGGVVVTEAGLAMLGLFGAILAVVAFAFAVAAVRLSKPE